jgi:hypothetical protein
MQPHGGNRRSLPPFRTCGLVGLLAACTLTGSLVIYSGLSVWVMLAMISVAVLIFLALVMATKIVVGYEIIVYYHNQIAVVAGTALFLRLFRQPVLPYLDITVLGVGLFLACGRIGCLLVGCCHGRPFRWGVRYGAQHAAAGFTPYYVDIPLFPVQAVESFWALSIVAVGASTIIRGGAPGSVLALYVVLYGLGRFYFEFLRGDPDRPYFLGFSEAQWTSFILIALTLSGEVTRRLPFRAWHLAIAACIVVTMIAVAVHRRFLRPAVHQLVHPRHIREIAQAILFAMPVPAAPRPANPDEGSQIRVGCTSLGVQISASELRIRGECRSHYAVSRDDGTMSPDSARELAKLICLLRHSSADFDLVRGNGGVFHVVIPTEQRRCV